MAHGLILEFEGVDLAKYNAVNANLGIDPATGEGNWPPGLRSHAAGFTENGTLIVTEIWKLKEDQGRFMQSRLGAAIAAAGFTSAPKLTWFEIAAHSTHDV